MRIEIESFTELDQLVRRCSAVPEVTFSGAGLTIAVSGAQGAGKSQVVAYLSELLPAAAVFVENQAARTVAPTVLTLDAEAFTGKTPEGFKAGLVSSLATDVEAVRASYDAETVGIDVDPEPDLETNDAAAHAEAQALVDGERAKPAEGAPVDKFGTPLDARIHQIPGKLNGDGSWRARRGVDRAQAAIIAADLREALARAQKVDGDAEPAATETHPLPTASPGDVVESTVEEPTAEILDLVESAKLIAGDVQQDSLIHVLTACKAFIVEQGMSRFELLKKAVAGDLVVQQYTPADCRLMLAAISLHQPGGAA